MLQRLAVEWADGLNTTAEPRIRQFEAADDALLVHWSSGRRSEFPYIWLRDYCRCRRCRNPDNGQRYGHITDLPAHPRPLRIEQDAADCLTITWHSDHHVSRYESAWLAAHDLHPDSRRARRPQPRLWSSDITGQLPELPWCDFDTAEGELRALERLRDFGFVLLRGTPLADELVGQVGERISFIRTTNYGRLWDVRDVPQANNLAYTAADLPLHTDNAIRGELMPGFVLLHCLVQSTAGGDSILVDGYRIAEDLRRSDPDAFDLLTRIPLTFRFVDADADIQGSRPTITTDLDGRLLRITYNHRNCAPHDIPVELIRPFYRAYLAFAALAERRDGQLRLKLSPGDLLIMDNQRVLHGRTGFDTATGHRHLKGCYVDRDGVESRLRVLLRQHRETSDRR